MRKNNTINAFFALLQAGIWEREVHLVQFGEIDFNAVYQIAEEQSVVGLIAAGLEHVVDKTVPRDVALTFAGSTLQIEQRNLEMNKFVADLIERMLINDIYALLIKGQGIAQCYERPLWRSTGDVDLFLSDGNYQKAVVYLSSLATHIENENYFTQHLAMTIDGWEVELHGSLRNGLWGRMDRALDELQHNVFCEYKVRSWMDGHTQIYLPDENEDIVFIFSHILQHYYKEGIGLRQLCDWCRLLWTYREKINISLLEKRLCQMDVKNEWKAFATFAVNFLDMPKEAMPFYNSSSRWHTKAVKIKEYVLKVGNFGHNESINQKEHSVLVRKFLTMINMIRYSMRHFDDFPINSLKTICYQMSIGFKALFRNNRKKEYV